MSIYQELLDEAMLGIVKKVLSRVQFGGLNRDQSFYISFSTEHPDVVLSRHVRNKYPKEITIVLQYQYRDLQVFDDKFKVNIAFGGISETIHVPFDAIIGFVDPGANFSLQFKRLNEIEELELDDEDEEEFFAGFEVHKANFRKQAATKKSSQKKKKAGKVIAIDQFRNRKNRDN